MTSGANNFNHFHRSQLTKFSALWNSNCKFGPKWLLNELASAIWPLIHVDANISDQLPKLYKKWGPVHPISYAYDFYSLLGQLSVMSVSLLTVLNCIIVVSHCIVCLSLKLDDDDLFILLVKSHWSLGLTFILHVIFGTLNFTIAKGQSLCAAFYPDPM